MTDIIKPKKSTKNAGAKASAEPEELLPIWTRDGADTGKSASKAEVHRRGLWHPTAHIWLREQESGQLLLQLRAAEKDSYPNCWDVSAAGHVSAGESLEQAALRELEEELGLRLQATELQFLFSMPYYGHYDNGLIDCEWQFVYLAELSVSDSAPLRDFCLQDGEVSALRWVSLPELEALWAELCAVSASEAKSDSSSCHWQGFPVEGFALHRRYPEEGNEAVQQPPKPLLKDNCYWAEFLGASL